MGMDNRLTVGRSPAEMRTDPTADREYIIIIIISGGVHCWFKRSTRKNRPVTRDIHIV
jgi:hypothetical protein